MINLYEKAVYLTVQSTNGCQWWQRRLRMPGTATWNPCWAQGPWSAHFRKCGYSKHGRVPCALKIAKNRNFMVISGAKFRVDKSFAGRSYAALAAMFAPQTCGQAMYLINPKKLFGFHGMPTRSVPHNFRCSPRRFSGELTSQSASELTSRVDQRRNNGGTTTSMMVTVVVLVGNCCGQHHDG